VSSGASADLVQNLRQQGYLGDDGKLQSDPRKSRWRDVVSRVTDLQHMPLESDKSSLSEVMNVAWAIHELFHDGTDKMFDFFEIHTRSRRSRE